jgi:hypothetical protein
VPFWCHFSGLEHKLHGALHAHQQVNSTVHVFDDTEFQYQSSNLSVPVMQFTVLGHGLAVFSSVSHTVCICIYRTRVSRTRGSHVLDPVFNRIYATASFTSHTAQRQIEAITSLRTMGK